MLAKFKQAFKVLGCYSLLMSVMSLPAVAATPSPEMMAQFQKLPKAQQQQLMKQYGLTPETLGLPGQVPETLEEPTLVEPRNKTAFVEEESDQPKTFEEQQEQPLKPFGYDLFAGEPTTFAPVSDIPVPSEYNVGPGDVIKIQLYGKENQDHSLTISRDGNLQLPEMGPMSVIGLSFDELKSQVIDRIKQRYLGVEVSVSLGELRSIRVLIAGEAHKPGSYTISSLSTITQALFVSGGVSEIGSLRNIELKRQGKVVGRFDLYDLLLKGDASNDFRLQSGDVVFIPAIGTTVGVKGEVRRPATYELKGGETINDLIRLAAGLKANAYPQKALLQRFDENHLPSLLNVDLTKKEYNQLAAKDGDLLEIKSTSENVRQQVLLVGAVSRPGQYQWRDGMRVSDLINSRWSDIKGKADLQYSLIAREINIQGDIEVLNFSLEQVINNPGSEDDLHLSPRDKILVFNHRDSSVAGHELEELIESQLLTHKFELMFALANSENLKRDEKLSKQQEKSQFIKDFKANLFFNKHLIAKSALLNRSELLLPVIEQLKLQSSNTGAESLVTIGGEVRFPGTYPLSEQIRVRDLIQAAGGLKESAYIKHAELTSIRVDSDDGASVEHRPIQLWELQQGDDSHNSLLKSKDHLQILQLPEWQEKLKVAVYGEVKFPGTYSIRKGETLMSVVKRAGGFTESAFIDGAIFTRESVKEQERQQRKDLASQLRREVASRGLSDQNSTVNFEEATLMLDELEKIDPIGRMILDLPAVANNAGAEDIRLEDKDRLYIPSVSQLVTIVGEVHHTSTHFHKKDKEYLDYIQLAGGIKQRADDDNVYVVRANGSVMIPEQSYWYGQKNEIQPGDTIVVPLDVEYKDSLTMWSQVTTIFYNTAVALAAINNV